jgi:hypothetical protein
VITRFVKVLVAAFSKVLIAFNKVLIAFNNLKTVSRYAALSNLATSQTIAGKTGAITTRLRTDSPVKCPASRNAILKGLREAIMAAAEGFINNPSNKAGLRSHRVIFRRPVLLNVQAVATVVAVEIFHAPRVVEETVKEDLQVVAAVAEDEMANNRFFIKV